VDKKIVFSAKAPASISNLGPGFDCLGLALHGWHDTVHVKLTDVPDYQVTFNPNGAWSGPTDPKANTASVAAMHVAELSGYEGGAHLEIHKGIHAGSGLGSSAASAVAGALAMNLALGGRLAKHDLIDSCLAGESVVSGAKHGDNVIPALMGGIVLVEPGNPAVFRRIAVPGNLHLAVILPSIEVLTHQARTILPHHVDLHAASVWASRLGQLVDAIHSEDVSRIGHLVMSDEIVEPIRATLLAPYNDIKNAALSGGAKGCALSGSGPAMFAVCDSAQIASDVAKRMQLACSKHGIESIIRSDSVNRTGATKTD
jgi:homoserine kinase